MIPRLFVIGAVTIWAVLMVIGIAHSVYTFGWAYTMGALAATSLIVWFGKKLWEVKP
jgi:hypothetical protein